jgi:hypothetical protein
MMYRNAAAVTDITRMYIQLYIRIVET